MEVAGRQLLQGVRTFSSVSQHKVRPQESHQPVEVAPLNQASFQHCTCVGTDVARIQPKYSQQGPCFCCQQCSASSYEAILFLKNVSHRHQRHRSPACCVHNCRNLLHMHLGTTLSSKLTNSCALRVLCSCLCFCRHPRHPPLAGRISASRTCPRGPSWRSRQVGTACRIV
jgi:hypothetical protein